MTPADAAQETITRWERERPERERRALERDDMTPDAYIARWDDPGKEPLNA
jgi:hypothetical protein